MKIICLISALLFFTIGFSQKTLVVHYYSLFGKQKSFQIFNNSTLHYKLKGNLLYTSHKLVNMNDSLLVFDNDYILNISQIKCIKIKGAHLSTYFFGAGFLFFLLDTGHNVAYGRQQIVSEQAVLVTSIAIISGIIVKRIQDKHIYIRKNVILKVLDTNYENLNIGSN